jgi:hypothetical protein
LGTEHSVPPGQAQGCGVLRRGSHSTIEARIRCSGWTLRAVPVVVWALRKARALVTKIPAFLTLSPYVERFSVNIEHTVHAPEIAC